MREHETGAPSLRDWVVVPREATKAMSDAGWAVSEAADKDWKSCTPRQLWIAMLAAAPPTAMAEAVASARAEGYMAGAMDMRDTAANAINASAHRLFGEEADALCVAALGTATLMVRGLPLIPGGSSDV